MDFYEFCYEYEDFDYSMSHSMNDFYGFEVLHGAQFILGGTIDAYMELHACIEFSSYTEPMHGDSHDVYTKDKRLGPECIVDNCIWLERRLGQHSL